MTRSMLATMLVGVAVSFTEWTIPADAAVMCYGRAATILGTAGKDIIKGTQHADVIIVRAGNDRNQGSRRQGSNLWRSR